MLCFGPLDQIANKCPFGANSCKIATSDGLRGLDMDCLVDVGEVRNSVVV